MKAITAGMLLQLAGYSSWHAIPVCGDASIELARCLHVVQKLFRPLLCYSLRVLLCYCATVLFTACATLLCFMITDVP
jgi:hypothetical protein